MLEEYQVMMLQFQEFKKSLVNFEHEAGSAVLYKLLAFDIVEDLVEDLERQLTDAQDVIKQYAYEN
jgi:hypothetical protein